MIVAGINMLEIHDHIGCCLREQPGVSVDMLHELTSIARPTPVLPHTAGLRMYFRKHGHELTFLDPLVSPSRSYKKPSNIGSLVDKNISF